jgi:hypothetical protein
MACGQLSRGSPKAATPDWMPALRAGSRDDNSYLVTMTVIFFEITGGLCGTWL